MRVLFTVALVVVIIGVTMPAVEYVGVDRSATETRDAVDELVEAARTLAAGNDALPNEAVAARRVVSLDVPEDGFASARLEFLSIGPPESGAAPTGRHAIFADDSPNGDGTRITWRVDGGQQHVVQVDDLRMRPTDGERFELHGGGSQRLVLRFLVRDGRRVVTVSRQRFK